MRVLENYLLKNATSINIGGPAKYFFRAKNEDDIIGAVDWARINKCKWLVIGGGCNLVPSDSGYNGLVIKNEVSILKRGKKIYFGSGNNLLKTIFELNRLGLAGMEHMAGIPGTVGGAIYGCAGAYGQEIKDKLIRVKLFDSKNLKMKWARKQECEFSYRESIFKKKRHLIILGAEFGLRKGNPKTLMAESRKIIDLRNKKFPKNLLCPGSFFKNIIIKDMRPALKSKLISKIDKAKIVNGKIPAGYLLERVGSRGLSVGGIKVADYHGNLIYNAGNGTAAEVLKLAALLKEKVRKKFGISLEEEIQYV